MTVSVRLASAYCRLRRSTTRGPEHARDADRVDQAERRQQDQQLQDDDPTGRGSGRRRAPASVATIGRPSLIA